jgi:hypothetical protein
MANLDLWERVWGAEGGDGTPEDEKIAIHSFWGMVSEWDRGYEIQANVLATFNIAAGDQTTQAQAIKQHINAAPDKTEFIRICKDWSYTAENKGNAEAAKYRDFAQFTTRMADAVTDQGGTPP